MSIGRFCGHHPVDDRKVYRTRADDRNDLGCRFHLWQIMWWIPSWVKPMMVLLQTNLTLGIMRIGWIAECWRRIACQWNFPCHTKLVLTMFFRTGSEWDDCQNILSRSKVLDVLAHSPIQDVRSLSRKFVLLSGIQFEPVRMNIVRTSLVWREY